MCVMHSGLKPQEEGEIMSGNILITGATMVLPTGTVVGDLRIKVGDCNLHRKTSKQSMVNLFMMQLDCICFQELSTPKFFRNLASLRRKISTQAPVLLLVAE